MIQNFSKFIKEKITFQYHKELCQDFWTDYQLDEKIRQKLLSIAQNFYSSLELDLELKDIQLTGSIANFNYNQYSDLDIHLIVDFQEYQHDPDLLKRFVSSKKWIWNQQHEINLRGYDVELYVQDIQEQHVASGLFSLLNNKWIIRPEYLKPKVDLQDVELKYQDIVNEINQLEESSTDKNLTPKDYENYYHQSEDLKTKIHKYRKSGLDKVQKEFSIENLVFKELRNKGDIERLFDLSNVLYDKIFIQ